MSKIRIEYTAEEGYVKPDLIGGKEWLDELRSGKYKPNESVLCSLDAKGKPIGYCCLGVKCEMDGILNHSSLRSCMVAKYDNSENYAVLPKKHPWALNFGSTMLIPQGFEVTGITDNNHKTFRELTALNDFLCNCIEEIDHKYIFPMIANVIDAAWNCLPDDKI